MENTIIKTSNQTLATDPVKAMRESGQFNAELFAMVSANPDAFQRKTPFDGLGRSVKTEELEEKKVYFFDCAILDFDSVDPQNPPRDPQHPTVDEIKHYHYSVWRGILEDTGESIIYSAGTKLTQLAECLLNGENEAAYNAVREKGAHLYFPKMRRLANGHTFMDPDLIP